MRARLQRIATIPGGGGRGGASLNIGAASWRIFTNRASRSRDVVRATVFWLVFAVRAAVLRHVFVMGMRDAFVCVLWC